MVRTYADNLMRRVPIRCFEWYWEEWSQERRGDVGRSFSGELRWGRGSIHRPGRFSRRLLSVFVDSRHLSSRHMVAYICNVNVVVSIPDFDAIDI